MTSYKIMYQVRTKAGKAGLPGGDWQDKESVVVAGEDAMEAVLATFWNNEINEFRLRGVELIGQVDIVVEQNNESSN